jgi:hypothetical protein
MKRLTGFTFVELIITIVILDDETGFPVGTDGEDNGASISNNGDCLTIFQT